MSETGFALRTASLADLPALDVLFSKSYPALLKKDYPPSVLVTAIPLISRAQPDLVASGTFYVVTEAADLVGAGGWTAQAPGGRAGQQGIGHIRHVVTDHTRTRQGIGRLLLTHVVAEAKVAGLNMLHCQSTRTAVPFYQSVGFEVKTEIDIALRPGIRFPAVFMTRPV